MNVSFPNPTLLSALSVLAFSLPVCGQNSGENQGQQLILASAAKLQSYETLEAKMRVRTDLLGQPLVGAGRYAQLKSSSGLLLRLELTIQAGAQPTSIKHISDGRSLWEHWRIGDTERIKHIDLGRVARSLRDNPATLSMGASSLASGGLPKLVSQLASNFDFRSHPVRTERIGEQGEVEALAIVGIWKKDRLAAAAPEAVQGDHIAFEKLPAHLPHQVEILMGKADLFPYRVTYQRLQNEGTVIPVVITQFFGLRMNDPMDASQFQYAHPKHVQVADQTDAYLQSLGIASKQQPATKR